VSETIKSPKKLIEVALPLDAINEAAAREKSIRHAHPSTLHLWWARRPLAAARAVIFSQMVNDPSWKWDIEHPGEKPPSNLKASWAASRKRLFTIIEDLVKWENSTNEEVLERARAEIQKSWRETCELNKGDPEAKERFNPEKLPALYDPFAGGGAIPLEAQRLGLDVYASDLNPVAVLINKAVVEIPPKFAGQPPVNPNWQRQSQSEKHLRQWQGPQGLSSDVEYYGQWMRDEAERRIGQFYPPIEVTADMAKGRPDLKPLVGRKLDVIAWLWARTVKSPNPAFSDVRVPLVASFLLGTKPGKETYVQPVINGKNYSFTIRFGKSLQFDAAKHGTKFSRANFRCLMSGTPISGEYIKAEGRAGRIGVRLLAVVAEGDRGRVYFAPTQEMEDIARRAIPAWKPEVMISGSTQYIGVKPYGIDAFSRLFTDRQCLALTTLTDLVQEVRNRVETDALDVVEKERGNDAIDTRAYSEAIATYLGLAVGRVADYSSTVCTWASNPQMEIVRGTFARQALQMTWDFAEANLFGPSTGSLGILLSWIVKVIDRLPGRGKAKAFQDDATAPSGSSSIAGPVISTDPPYFDNVPYADLSDFFYVWLRRALRPTFPELFATVAVPKERELVAFAYRHKDREAAGAFFMKGMTQAMDHFASIAHPAYPVTMYYAFKQTETESGETTSTGWETFLEAVMNAGFGVRGTWPIRTERSGRSRDIESNALASSIVVVVYPRPSNAPTTSRRAFLRELNQLLPEALDEMTRGTDSGRSPVAPVDLSQAIIGRGMAIFSKYAAVLEADGSRMNVKSALSLINRFLAEDDFDHDTQFCLHWFNQHGWNDGKFGEADTLARAKGTSVEGVKRSGVLYATGGVVRLLKWTDYPTDSGTTVDDRLSVWAVLHHLIRRFRSEGESGGGAVLAAVQTKVEATRQLAYRLYTLCERSGWAEDARSYNEIVTSWSALESAATSVPYPKQAALFDA
jgi:putative DNA methylase